MKKDIEQFIGEALENVRKDRTTTESLLVDLMVYIKESKENHKEVGLVAAKYLETLQRSNEQLVKITAIIQKKSSKKEGLTDFDKKEIFDLIQGAE
jgi:hypothetical protein